MIALDYAEIHLEYAEEYAATYALDMPKGLEREGVLVHFDGSSSDRGGITYLRRSKLGYTFVVRDDGGIVLLADPKHRTPHAGLCRTPNANSVFYGVAALTNEHVPVTPEQFEGIAQVIVACWRHHRERWGAPTPENIRRRVRGHHEEAIYGRSNTKRKELWGKGGRKCDPRGLPEEGLPLILDMDALRARVQELLT